MFVHAIGLYDGLIRFDLVKSNVCRHVEAISAHYRMTCAGWSALSFGLRF
jgi:hypothetical protein